MTTSTYSSPIEQSSDATFRTWITALSTELDLYLPKTADTGQITLASATRPAVNTAAGYEIRRFNDTLQATAPIYIKIEYGSGASTDRPAVWITVGKGSNGSGTITSIFFARKLISGSDTGVLVSTVISYPSFFCAVDGAFSMALKIGAYNSSICSTVGTLQIQRTVDTTGAPTTEGCVIHSTSASGGITAICTNFSTNLTLGGSNAFAMVPYGMTATLVGAGPQVMNHVAALPAIRACAFSVTCLSSEIADLASFSATPVGTTAHTYLSLGNGGGAASVAATTAHRFCMIYE